MLVAIGAGIAVLTCIGAGIDIPMRSLMPVQQMSVPTVVYDRYDPPDIRTAFAVHICCLIPYVPHLRLMYLYS